MNPKSMFKVRSPPILKSVVTGESTEVIATIGRVLPSSIIGAYRIVRSTSGSAILHFNPIPLLLFSYLFEFCRMTQFEKGWVIIPEPKDSRAVSKVTGRVSKPRTPGDLPTSDSFKTKRAPSPTTTNANTSQANRYNKFPVELEIIAPTASCPLRSPLDQVARPAQRVPGVPAPKVIFLERQLTPGEAVADGPCLPPQYPTGKGGWC